MAKSTEDLLSIIRAGAGIAIPATRPTRELVLLAKAARQAGTQLILKRPRNSTADCQLIAAEGAHHVIFDFD